MSFDSYTHYHRFVSDHTPPSTELVFSPPVDTYATANERTFSRTAFCELANHKRTTIGRKRSGGNVRFS